MILNGEEENQGFVSSIHKKQAVIANQELILALM